jgi:hypothetical protein
VPFFDCARYNRQSGGQIGSPIFGSFPA